MSYTRPNTGDPELDAEMTPEVRKFMALFDMETLKAICAAIDEERNRRGLPV